MLIIKILNLGTNEKNEADYSYKVYVNQELIEEGNVKKFQRDLGWKNLVKRIVTKKHQKKGEK